MEINPGILHKGINKERQFISHDNWKYYRDKRPTTKTDEKNLRYLIRSDLEIYSGFIHAINSLQSKGKECRFFYVNSFRKLCLMDFDQEFKPIETQFAGEIISRIVTFHEVLATAERSGNGKTVILNDGDIRVNLTGNNLGNFLINTIADGLRPRNINSSNFY